jgi:hypothetical protein
MKTFTLGNSTSGATFVGDPSSLDLDKTPHRISLWRHFDESNDKTLMVIGLNPSTATHEQDDPTIRRCIRFARDWGFGRYVMCNLFSLRATLPKVMLAHPKPNCIENDKAIFQQSVKAHRILTAWGNHGVHRSQGNYVRSILAMCEPAKERTYYLARNKSGEPKHPLYVAADTKPVLWSDCDDR